MTDVRLEKLADLIVQYSIAVQPGEKVIIRSMTPAEPLLNEVYAKIVAAGGYPFMALKFPETSERFFEIASVEGYIRSGG